MSSPIEIVSKRSQDAINEMQESIEKSVRDLHSQGHWVVGSLTIVFAEDGSYMSSCSMNDSFRVIAALEIDKWLLLKARDPEYDDDAS